MAKAIRTPTTPTPDAQRARIDWGDMAARLDLLARVGVARYTKLLAKHQRTAAAPPPLTARERAMLRHWNLRRRAGPTEH